MYDLDFKTKNNDGSKKLTPDALINMYQKFVADYPMVSIEDPFDQDDFESYTKVK